MRNVIAVQSGSRRRYMVPRLLYELGYLKYLYTDSCVYSPLGLLAKTISCFYSNERIVRLTNRMPIGLPKKYIKTSDRNIYNLFFLNKTLSKEERYIREHDAMSGTYIKWGADPNDIIYIMNGEAIPFMQYCKNKGCKIINDIYENPNQFYFIKREIEKHKEFFSTEEINEICNYYHAKLNNFKKALSLSDILLCPSDWVAKGVFELSPESFHKIRIIPYGCSLTNNSSEIKFKKGRFIFVGSNLIGKGLLTLGECAALLKDYNIEFIVIGATKDNFPPFKGKDQIHFLGKLTHTEIAKQYKLADALVFPTVSEGLSGVVVEACSLGCPVITTEACGVNVLKDGYNALIVPIGDSEALSKAVLRIYNDNEFRNYLSNNAYMDSKIYSVTEWKKRLNDLLSDL